MQAVPRQPARAVTGDAPVGEVLKVTQCDVVRGWSRHLLERLLEKSMTADRNLGCGDTSSFRADTA